MQFSILGNDSEFETPFFRDLSKFLVPVMLGVVFAMVILVAWYPVSSEIRFNVNGALDGYNIILDRHGDCFLQENRSTCSSGAWPVSIFLVMPIPALIILNIWLWYKRKQLDKDALDEHQWYQKAKVHEEYKREGKKFCPDCGDRL